MRHNRNPQRFLQLGESLNMIGVSVGLDDRNDVGSLGSLEDLVGFEAPIDDHRVMCLRALEHVHVVLHRTDFDLANDEVVAFVVVGHRISFYWSSSVRTVAEGRAT
jgi:hypothetical protein